MVQPRENSVSSSSKISRSFLVTGSAALLGRGVFLGVEAPFAAVVLQGGAVLDPPQLA